MNRQTIEATQCSRHTHQQTLLAGLVMSAFIFLGGIFPQLSMRLLKQRQPFLRFQVLRNIWVEVAPYTQQLQRLVTIHIM